MRILHLTAMWPRNGFPASGTFVWSLVQGLNEIGVTNDVLVIPALESRFAYFAIAPKFLRACGEGQYDIVHAHYAHAVLIASLQRSVPVVAHFHGEYDGAKDAILASVASRLVPHGIAVDKKAFNRIRSRHKALIPIGADSREFKPMDRTRCRQALKFDPSRKYVLFPSTPEKAEKNYRLFVKTMELVRRELPEAEMVILRDLPHDLVPIYMNAVDVMLLTSRTEASPTVVKEALLCNLPIVATDVGDVKNLLQGVQQCAVVPSDSLRMSAEAVTMLRSGSRSDGRKKREVVELTRTVEHLLSFYDEVLVMSKRQN